MYETSTYLFLQLFPAIFILQTISLMSNSPFLSNILQLFCLSKKQYTVWQNSVSVSGIFGLTNQKCHWHDLGCRQPPPMCRPPFFLVMCVCVVVEVNHKVASIQLKIVNQVAIDRLSLLYEDFVRVKTLMGLERFEVGKTFSPISQSLGIY